MDSSSRTRGRQLIAGLLAGETLEISKVMVGSGQLTEGMEPSEITDLISPVAIGYLHQTVEKR